jgi:organic hydroperoxide reductase OsmC/OhrA
VASCTTATFCALAQRAGVEVLSLRCRAKGVLDRAGRTVGFTSVELAVSLRVAQDDVARARTLLDDAKHRCFVTNSLRCPVDLVADVAAG